MHDTGTASESTRAGPLAESEHRRITSVDAKEQQLFLYINHYIIVIASSCSTSTARVSDKSYNFSIVIPLILFTIIVFYNGKEVKS